MTLRSFDVQTGLCQRSEGSRACSSGGAERALPTWFLHCPFPLDPCSRARSPLPVTLRLCLRRFPAAPFRGEERPKPAKPEAQRPGSMQHLRD